MELGRQRHLRTTEEILTGLLPGVNAQPSFGAKISPDVTLRKQMKQHAKHVVCINSFW